MALDDFGLDWEPFLDLSLFQDPIQTKPMVQADQHAMVSIVTDMDRPLMARMPPPAGTIYMYSTTKSLYDDEPIEEGTLGDFPFFDGIVLQDPYRVHMLIRKSIEKEFKVEDRYRRKMVTGHQTRHRDKRRRNPLECNWKPESVYKTYIDCKPEFFDKSDYQDHIPSTSCFGKINMRIPKAWSRGPNKPRKRKKRETHTEPDDTFMEIPLDQDINSDAFQLMQHQPFFDESNPLQFDFFFP